MPYNGTWLTWSVTHGTKINDSNKEVAALMRYIMTYGVLRLGTWLCGYQYKYRWLITRWPLCTPYTSPYNIIKNTVQSNLFGMPQKCNNYRIAGNIGGNLIWRLGPKLPLQTYWRILIWQLLRQSVNPPNFISRKFSGYMVLCLLPLINESLCIIIMSWLYLEVIILWWVLMLDFSADWPKILLTTTAMCTTEH